MLQSLAHMTRRLPADLRRFVRRKHDEWTERGQTNPATVSVSLRPLERVILTDGVGRTLFDDWSEHLASKRSHEETGWDLLGIREQSEAIVLATLPAGAARDAGAGHVRFNSWGQVLGSRIVRQSDRRLTMLGVVHTHPGSLRHPSDEDFRGDSEWVTRLRGQEGIFGIGTADCVPANGTPFARQPSAHVQCLGKLRWSWYSLRAGAAAYRPLAVSYTLGPDLACELHKIWPVIEEHAERLDTICRQQTGVTVEFVEGNALAVQVPLAEPGCAIRVLIREKDIGYYLLRNGEVNTVNLSEERIDRAIYVLLSELAA